MHEDHGPKYAELVDIAGPNIKKVTGFNGAKNIRIGVSSDSLLIIEGFNNADTAGFATYWFDSNADSTRVVGFNKAKLCNYAKIWSFSALPSKINIFENAVNVEGTIELKGIRDTLRAFPKLEAVIKNPVSGGFGGIYLSAQDSAYVDPTSFSKLHTTGSVQNSTRYGKKLLPFPELVTSHYALFTEENPYLITYENAYPKLERMGGFTVRKCPNLTVLDDFPNIKKVKPLTHLGQSNPPELLRLENLPLLTDCRALCNIFQNATLEPSIGKIIIEGVPFPCDSRANVEAWCDTLSVAASEPFLPQKTTEKLAIWPNPISNETGAIVHFSIPEPFEKPILVVVFDATGRKRYHFKTVLDDGKTGHFIARSLPAGFYSLVLDGVNGVRWSTNFIKI